VFTLRRPGETQVGDPDNAEPITAFELAEPVSGSFQEGYWRTSITVFGSEASKYVIMPEALVILFTEDTYGTTAGSLGPIDDRENILLVGRIVGDTIRTDPETGDVTFEVASPGMETSLYHNYPAVIQNNDGSTQWIDTPDLTCDRVAQYYIRWHTTLTTIADFYQTGDTIEVFAQDFLEGDIYSNLNQYLYDRLFARLLCDKYGRFYCEIDAQDRAFGGTTTLWTMTTADWLDEVNVRQIAQAPVSAVECGGLIYSQGAVVPKLSHAPGLFSKYRGSRQTATSLAIVDQDDLNTKCGRHLQGLNHEFEIDLMLAGNWRYCDIAPQRVVNIGTLTTDREALTGTYIIRAVSNTYDPDAGVILTEIQTEQEMPDGTAGATIDIPEDLPDPIQQPPRIPVNPGFPPNPGWGVPDGGRRIIATTHGVYVTDNIAAQPPVWYGANTGFSTDNDRHVYSIARDPWHWWTSGGTERTLWCVSRTGVWKHENFPSGTWVQQISYATFIATFGYTDTAPNGIDLSTINMSIETDGHYVLGLNVPDYVGFPFFSAKMTAVAVVCQDDAIVNWTAHPGYSALNPTATFASGAVGWHQVKFNPHSADQIIYSSPSYAPYNVGVAARELFRTANGGAAWASVDGPYAFAAMNYWASISIPYSDGGNSVLWASKATHRISTDGASSFGDVPNIAAAFEGSILGTSGIDDRMLLIPDRPDTSQIRYSVTSGTLWNLLPLAPIAMQGTASWSSWNGDFLRSVLIGGQAAAGAVGPVYIYRWIAETLSWQDKTGNMNDFGALRVYDIDRDSMGSA